MSLIKSIPTFTDSATLEEYRAAFESVQCVRFKQAIDYENPSDCGGRNGDDDSLCRSSKSKHGASQIEKKRKCKRKRKRGDNSNSNSNVKESSSRNASSKAKSLADHYQAVLLQTIQSASSKDQESWVVENNENGTISSNITPVQFLSPHINNMQRGYCSFLLQDNSNGAVSNFTKQHVPTCKQNHHQSLPLLFSNAEEEQEIEDTIYIADPYWFFIGRNVNIHDDSTDSNTSASHIMKGRTEHTDDIHHNGGTVHYQIVGDKTWKLRPTEELRERCRNRSRDNNTNVNNMGTEVNNELKDHYIVTVEEGDLLVINTRLWWHQTEIPPFSAKDTKGGARTPRRRGKHKKRGRNEKGLRGSSSSSIPSKEAGTSSSARSSTHISISYARDIYLDGTQPSQSQDGNTNTNASESDTVCNKEGAWATGFIPKGTVLLTEEDGPPPIMARTRILTEANCKLISVAVDEDEDNDNDTRNIDESGDGKMALVTIKDIQEGVFFTLLDEKEGHGDDEKGEKVNGKT